VHPPSTTWTVPDQPCWLKLVCGSAVFLICFGASLGVEGAAFAPARPNILFILSDDLGYGDLSYHNPSSKIQTPRLDALASQGICFSSAHAPSGLCTPSRYSLLCGEFCWRSRLKSGVLHSWDEPVIARERVTVASMLRERGYATGCFGKWHLGLSWPFVGVIPPGFDTTVKASDLDWTRRIGGGPIDHGFDYFFGLNIANEPPYAYILNDHVLGIPNAHYDTATGLQSHWGGPGVSGWDWSRVLPDVVTNAVDWLQRKTSQNSAQPFFLYLALPGPHQPVVPNAQFTGTSRAGLYGDYVQELDWAVGQMLDALQASGAATNTLVIFTSDNGPDEFTYERIQQYNHSSIGGLRGIKNDLWEGGHRVPFIARWPGQISAGTSNAQVICHVDFMRTVADLVGAPLPAHTAEDSISFLPALVGGTPASVRTSLILESGRGQFGLWTNRWMFIDSSTGDGHNPEFEPLWFKQSRGYPLTNNSPAVLYDLTRDLAESTNLYTQQAALSSQLQTLLRHQRGIQSWCGTQSGSWTNCANWSQNNLPAGSDLIYSNLTSGAVFTQTLGTNLSINSLSLLTLAQPLTLQAGGPFSLTIANGIDMSLASADLALTTPLALAESQFWRVTSNRTLKVDGPISLNRSDLMISGHGNVVATNTISGTGRLTLRGSGFVLLGGNNTYSGGTEISGGGFLVAKTSGALGSGSVDIPNNSTLQVEPGVSLTNPLTILGNGGTFRNITCGAITLYHAGHAEIHGPVTLVNDAAVGVHALGGVLTFTGPISGNANLTILPGDGVVVFAANNLYTGSTLIGGKLALDGDERLPATTQVLLANSTNSSLDLGNNHQTVRLLSGGGKVTLANGTLLINQDMPSVFAGTLNGTGVVIKTNSGVLTLSGSNSLSGTTAVSGGGLQVNGVFRDSGIVVRSAMLSGTGVITGPVRIEAGGNLFPGPALGTLTVSNSLNLADNSTTTIQLDSFRRTAASVAGSSHVHYGGVLFVTDLSATPNLTSGQSFRIFSASSETGQFSAIQPSPGPGLAWAFYPANGTLSVVAQSNLRASQSDSTHFVVTWSGVGFHLQAQTNSLSPSAANWFDYPGATTSPVTLPFNPESRALFFRLVSP
jgi:arylsulfatase A